MAERIDEIQIRRTLELMKSPGEVIEVRIIGNKTLSGYFKDIDNLIKQVKRYDGDNIYFVMNTIKDECYGRTQRENICIPKNTTSDADIEGRRWILIDIDSKKTTGISATDDEKDKAKEVGNKVFEFLRDIGFSEPICADSGNGVHLLYSIKLANTQDTNQLIRNILLVLDMMFSNDNAQVDTAVFNAARITKLYGTVARKGADTKERPHRLSKIIKAPDDIKITDISLLKKVADMLPKPEEKSINNAYGSERFELDAFLSRNRIQVKNIQTFSGGKKYILEKCIFDESHTKKDAAIFQLDNGAIGYKCFHNSCQSYKWQDVRKKFEPNAYDKKILPYKDRYVIAPQKKEPQPEVQEKGNKFLQMHEIKNIDRSKLIYIRSHITEIDKKIIGFLKGDTSIWSGVNASGKSTILGQLCLNAINDGFKTIMYSGELQPHRVKNWLHLQAAGRQFTMPTEFENLYYVPENIGKYIDEWMKDKFFLYNNNYGSEYTQLIADLTERLSQGDIDMIVLDNIMTLDLDELAFDNNAKQKSVIKSISELAKKYNTHIHIVAHPKKTINFLRKNDISGSSDLSNVVDNVFIIHRVNNDFIRLSDEYFGEKEAAWMHKYDNVIEICKNRDIGILDFITGVYFEKESKRFLNERFDNIVYGWQDTMMQTNINYKFEPASSLPFMMDQEPLPF